MFRAIGRGLHWIWSGLDGLRKVLHLLLMLALFGILWGAFSRPIPLVPDKAALVIRPRGPIVEQLTGDPLERAIAEIVRQQPTQTLLRDVVDAIESAADDDRISSLYLDVGGLERGGLAKLQEIAAAIDGFRATGKPVIAYGGYYEQGQYYLAAHADEIYLDPMGAVFVDGFANYGTFVKDALDKLSVDVHLPGRPVQVGGRDIQRNDRSPAEREESLAATTVGGTDRAEVARRASSILAVLQAIAYDARVAAQGRGDLATIALDARLVTRSDSRRSRATDRADHRPRRGRALVRRRGSRFYLANVDSQQALASGSRRKIGLIVASGEIVPGEQPPGMVGSDTLAALLRDALFDDSVKAVVLRIDSPGGSVYASEVIRRQVRALREAGKPVVASMSSLAASGGYYIAMDADRIVASPATLTGSIGIFAMFPTINRSLERLGVHTDGVGTTALSGEFRLDRPMGDASKDLLQQTIQRGYDDFIGRVAKARKQPVEAIDAVAQGRVWGRRRCEARRSRGRTRRHRGRNQGCGKAGEARRRLRRRVFRRPDQSWRCVRAASARGPRPRRRAVAAAGSASGDSVGLSPLLAEAQRLARLKDPGSLYAYCLACSLD